MGAVGEFATLANQQRLKIIDKIGRGEELLASEALVAKVVAEGAEFALLAKTEGVEKVAQVVQFVQHDAEFAALEIGQIKDFTQNVGKPARYKALASGEQCRITRPISDLKAIDWADARWEEIRACADDVQKIAKNTGLPEFKIKRIKKHVFFDEHIRNIGEHEFIARFDADIEMVQSWDRLCVGDFVVNDITLLNHEYCESKYEQLFKTTYIAAHDAAQNTDIWSWYGPIYKGK
jgi:hypothetical protein